MPKILIVDSDTAEKNAKLRAAGNPATGEGYAAALRHCRDDLTITIIAPYEGDALPPLDGFDGVVFTGSGVDWSTDDARAKPLADAMRRVFDKGLPTLGSCNGMQLAASVLGGSTDVSPNGREDGLAKNIHLTDAGRVHPLLKGRIDGYTAPCVHRDEVQKLPEGAVLLAGNDHSGVQAFAYEKDGIRFWGMQYHLEYPPAFLSSMLGKDGRMAAGDAADLAIADRDPAAAGRLGLRAEDMTPEVRLTELRNWLASL